MSEKKLEELKADLAELNLLAEQAKRPKIADLLSLEIGKLKGQIGKLQVEIASIPAAGTNSNQSTSRRYQVKLNNYAWDQTPKFVKFYITLQKVHTIAEENVKCQFTNKSLELIVTDLDNKDYIFTISNLLDKIDPDKSTWKIKTDMIIVNAAKIKNENWSHVTEVEKKLNDAKSNKFKPDDMNPSDGLMSLMKNMYETGDDEMKRTIAKSWTESQNKSASPN